jgi:hypothetical protein
MMFTFRKRRICHLYFRLFSKTDNLNNILVEQNYSLRKATAVKDVVDIVYICESTLKFTWEKIIYDASEKDLWVNPDKSCALKF